MPKVTKSKKSSKASAQFAREVIYEEVSSSICMEAQQTAITAQECKDLLGWQEETDEVKFANEYLLKDLHGCKIRCANNVTNRPLYKAILDTLQQEHLRKRWQFNGEPIIIGKTGLVLNGQHTMISLILAAQAWSLNKEKWEDYWTTEPTMDKLIVSGVDESDDTVNTMDTCKPRSLADVIYRSEFFSSMKTNDRRACSKITDYAIKLLWHRTGACLDAFAPRRTHAESLDFINRHPKLLACVKHVYEENGDDNKIGRYLSPGNASGLLFLMGCSASERKVYCSASVPSEDSLDWSNWDKACDFWVVLASCDKKTCAIRTATSKMTEDSGGLSNAEKCAIIVQAWNAYVNDKPITEETLKLDYLVDQDTLVKQLVEHPNVGGIDLGNPKEADENTIVAPDPTEAEIASASSKLRKKKQDNPKPTSPLKKTSKKMPLPSRAGDEWAVGDTAWVFAQDGEHYLGTIVTEPWQDYSGSILTEVESTDGLWEVNTNELSLEKPAAVAPKPAVVMPKSPAPTKHAKNATKSSKTAKGFKCGHLVWVDHKEPWQGHIKEIEGNNAKLLVGQGFQGAGNLMAARVAELSYDFPSK